MHVVLNCTCWMRSRGWVWAIMFLKMKYIFNSLCVVCFYTPALGGTVPFLLFCSFIQLVVRSFIRSFIHSFIAMQTRKPNLERWHRWTNPPKYTQVNLIVVYLSALPECKIQNGTNQTIHTHERFYYNFVQSENTWYGEHQPTNGDYWHPTNAPTNGDYRHPTNTPTNGDYRHPTNAPTNGDYRHPTNAHSSVQWRMNSTQSKDSQQRFFFKHFSHSLLLINPYKLYKKFCTNCLKKNRSKEFFFFKHFSHDIALQAIQKVLHPTLKKKTHTSQTYTILRYTNMKNVSLLYRFVHFIYNKIHRKGTSEKNDKIFSISYPWTGQFCLQKAKSCWTKNSCSSNIKKRWGKQY
jgi:hypothetical protein